MTREEVLLLLKAGYTKADIDAMKTAEPKPAQEPKPPQEPKPAPEPNFPQNPASAGAPDYAPVLAAIQQMQDNFIAALQKAAIGGSILSPGAGDQTIDSIMAQIINPYEEKKE